MFQSRVDLILRGALDGLAARHKLYVRNVANAETPGFVPDELPFEDQLRAISETLRENPLTDIGSVTLPTVDAVSTPQTTGRGDENGVSIDSQVMKFEENRLRYEALIQAARTRHELLHTAITESPR